MDRGYCAAKLPPSDFFRDCPWLDIPKERQAEILIEPQHPQGGLLGGALHKATPNLQSSLHWLQHEENRRTKNHGKSVRIALLQFWKSYDHKDLLRPSKLPKNCQKSKAQPRHLFLHQRKITLDGDFHHEDMSIPRSPYQRQSGAE